MISIFTLVLMSSVNATTFFPLGKEGVNTFYGEKAQCEEVEGVPCFDTTRCPIDECKLTTVQEEDPTLPPRRDIVAEIACEDEKDCESKLADICEGHSSGLPYWGDRQGDALLSAWCIVESVRKVTVTKPIPDPVKIEAKEQARQNARKKMETDEQALRNCLRVSPVPTAAEQRACIQILIRRIYMFE